MKERGVRLFTSTVRRPPPDTLDQRLNCHSKLHEVVALVQALEAGADEALMLDPTGAVATCNATNFFVVRRGEVWTSTGHYSLNGITRRMIIALCRALGIPVSERPFSLTDVYGADEAFVTGTFGGITPVIEVDGAQDRAGARGELTARLTDLYAEAIAEATRVKVSDCLRLSVWSGPAQRLDGAHVLLPAAVGYHGGGRTPLRPLSEDYRRGASRCQGGPGGDGQRRRAGGAGGHPRPVRASHPLLQEHGAPSPRPDPGFLDSITNVLLIRDPTEMLPSLAGNSALPPCGTRACASRTLSSTRSWRAVRKPIVLDARELLLDPPGVLRLSLRRSRHTFRRRHALLAGRPETRGRRLGQHWYHNVHASTGFAPYSPQGPVSPPRALLESAAPLPAARPTPSRLRTIQRRTPEAAPQRQRLAFGWLKADSSNSGGG